MAVIVPLYWYVIRTSLNCKWRIWLKGLQLKYLLAIIWVFVINLMFQRMHSTGVPLCIQKVKAGNCLYTIPIVYHCRKMYSCIAHNFRNCSNNVKFISDRALWEWKSRRYFWSLLKDINGHISLVEIFLCHYCKCLFSAFFMWDWRIFLEETWYTQKIQLEFLLFNIHKENCLLDSAHFRDVFMDLNCSDFSL